MPNNGKAFTLSSGTDAISILEAVADTLSMSPAEIPAAAKRVARKTPVGDRIRDIESTKDLSEKDFSLMINARG